MTTPGAMDGAFTSAAVGWVDVYDDEDLWEGEMVGVDAGGTGVLLVRTPDSLAAFLDRCPHQGNALSEGCLDDGLIVCAVHLWEFTAATGRGVNPANQHLSSIPARVVEGRIQVVLPPAPPRAG